MQTILIFGASNSGTTTLGRALNTRYNYAHLDTDDYFWIPTDPPFLKSRPIPERFKLLESDILKHEKSVITGSISWGGDEDSIIKHLTLAIRLHVSTDIRVNRAKKREAERFGSRILPGGDMYEEHTVFMEFVASYDIPGYEGGRSREKHDIWQKKLNCPIIDVDSSRPVDEILADINEIYPL